MLQVLASNASILYAIVLIYLSYRAWDAKPETRFGAFCLWQWFYVASSIDYIGLHEGLFMQGIQVAALSFTATYAGLTWFVRWRFFIWYFWWGAALIVLAHWAEYREWEENTFRWWMNTLFVFKIIAFVHYFDRPEAIDGRSDRNP